MTNFISVLLAGEPASEEGLEEFFIASGMSAVIARMGEVLGEEISLDEFDELLTKLDLREYMRLVDELSLSELMQARAFVGEMVNVAAPVLRLVATTYGFTLPGNLPELINEASESTQTFGLPLAAWVLKRHASGTAEIHEAIRVNGRGIEASALLLDHLPEEYWRFLGARGEIELAAASDQERHELLELAHRAFEKDGRLRELQQELSGPSR